MLGRERPFCVDDGYFTCFILDQVARYCLKSYLVNKSDNEPPGSVLLSLLFVTLFLFYFLQSVDVVLRGQCEN